LPGEPHHPARIYNYYCIHLKQAIQPAFVLDITAEWDRKVASVRAFESQFITGRPTASPTFFEHFEAEAAYWGKTIGVRYGEPFASREPIGMRSMGELV
jgi:LmbE family N-acetylglucosaminyl deacetylase